MEHIPATKVVEHIEQLGKYATENYPDRSARTGMPAEQRNSILNETGADQLSSHIHQGHATVVTDSTPLSHDLYCVLWANAHWRVYVVFVRNHNLHEGKLPANTISA